MIRLGAILLAVLVAGNTGPDCPIAQQPQARPTSTPGIYFVPTLHAVADEMLRLAGVTKRDLVYDLGSGDGRIVSLAAQK